MIELDPARPVFGGGGPAPEPTSPGVAASAAGLLLAAPAAVDWPVGPAWFAAGLAVGVVLASAWASRRLIRRLARERGRAAQLLDRYRMLVEHTRDIAIFVRPDGRIVEANQAAVVAYGHDRDALLKLRI